MKRFTAEHVLDIAQRFAAGRWAESWTLFGSRIRAALLDSVVMHEIRLANIGELGDDFKVDCTIAEITKLRRDLEAVLAEGVRPAAYSRRPKCAYKVED